jgi:hypothetical protein
MTDRYTLDDERRAGIDEAIERRQEQSNIDESDRDLDNPAGEGTVSGRTERESAAGGHGHGGALDLAVDKAAQSS